MNSRRSYGVASWLLVVLFLISVLITISFAAQNIRLRIAKHNLETEIGQYTDQSEELDNLRTQIETLKKENQSLNQDLEKSKSQLDKATLEIESLKKKTTSTRKR